MNRPIMRLFGLVALLFALLVAFTSRWTVFEASSLRENPLNARTLLEQQRIDRGPIVAADGTVLARSVRGAEGIYQRIYPTGEEFAHASATASSNRTSATPGSSATATRTSTARPARTCRAILDQLQGKKPQGDKVITSLDPRAQAVAISGARRTRRRGRRARPAQRSRHRDGLHAELRSQRAALLPRLRTADRRRKGRPLVNRATQFGYAPGLDVQGGHRHGRDRHRHVHAELARSAAATACSISGVPLQNDEQRELRRNHAHRRRSPTRSTPSGRRSPNGSASARWRATWTASASTASRSWTTPPKRCRPAASTTADA